MEDSKFIITINREFGSGGREIACKLGELLGVKVYDKAILASITSQLDVSLEEMERIKAKKTNWWSEFCSFYSKYTSAANFSNTAVFSEVNREITPMELYCAEKKILCELAEKESCVIIGRTGFHIFKDNPKAIKILIIANPECRVKRIMGKYNLDENEAIKRMNEVDKTRETFTKTFAGVSRYDARNYDCVFNVSGFSTDDVAKFLATNIRRRFPE